MTDSTQAAWEAFEVWWRKTERYEPRYAFLAGVEWNASRSIPAVVSVQERVTPENMHRLKAAYDAKRKVPIELTTGDEWAVAAAALFREAGWRVEEPVCETCKGSGSIPSNSRMRPDDYDCPTCNGTGKRQSESG